MIDTHGTSHTESQEFDGELNTSAIVKVGVATALVTIAAMVIVWWMLIGLRKLESRQDPAPSALPEAAEKLPPPAPRLEISPPANLEELRKEEAVVLDTPQWHDQAAGTVRLPIDLALDVVARRGLGDAEAPTAETAAPDGAMAPDATAPTSEAPAAAPAPTAPPGGGAR